MAKSFNNRNEIDAKYKWSIEDMYPDEKIWEEDIAAAVTMAEDYAKYAGKLTENSEIFLESLRLRDRLWQTLEKAYVYSRMKQLLSHLTGNTGPACRILAIGDHQVNRTLPFHLADERR